MLVIKLDHEYGHVVPDARCRKMIMRDYNTSRPLKSNFEVVYGSDMMIHTVHYLVLKGHIYEKDIVIMFGGEEIRIDEEGRFDKHPDGFLDNHANMLMEMMDIRLKLAKKSRRRMQGDL
jgi:hypothetical protein